MPWSCAHAFLWYLRAPFRSYDSKQEDAQNPFPSPCDTPGKETFQQGKAGKKQIRSPSTQTLLCETPPPILRKGSSKDTSGSMSTKVKRSLHRPQTVDEMNTTDRKANAKARQQQLEADFEQARAENEQEEANDKKKQKPKPGSTTTTKPNSKATAKATAKSKASPSPKKATKKSPPAAKKANAENDEAEAYSMKDHNTARSSGDPMPGQKRKPDAGPEAHAKQEGQSEPDSKKAKAEDNASNNEADNNEKKKAAHKLYMRFYRRVHSRCPRQYRFSIWPQQTSHPQ